MYAASNVIALSTHIQEQTIVLTGTLLDRSPHHHVYTVHMCYLTSCNARCSFQQLERCAHRIRNRPITLGANPHCPPGPSTTNSIVTQTNNTPGKNNHRPALLGEGRPNTKHNFRQSKVVTSDFSILVGAPYRLPYAKVPPRRRKYAQNIQEKDTRYSRTSDVITVNRSGGLPQS